MSDSTSDNPEMRQTEELQSTANQFIDYVLDSCQAIGKTILRLFRGVGSLSVFIGKAVMHSFLPPIYFRLIGRQIIDIGYYSLPVVGMTALFTGMVLALQSYTGFTRFNAESAVAAVVVLSITRELAPVLAGLMVAGRIGASIAAEIGTMRVTEQIDAMECLSLNPFRYLFMPRFVASLVMLPVLVIFSSFVGIMGALIVAAGFFDLDSKIFFSGVKLFFSLKDVFIGMFKAFIFGGIIATIGCYYGYFTSGGAVGVGESTKKSVVASSVLILIGCYLVDGVFL